MQHNRVRVSVALATVSLAFALCSLCAANAFAAAPLQARHAYRIDGIRTSSDRQALVSAGLAIDTVDEGSVVVTTTNDIAAKLKARGYIISSERQREFAPSQIHPGDFPSGDGAYHNFARLQAALTKIAAKYPKLVKRFTIGKSFEKRNLLAVELSDDVSNTSTKPEVLITAGQHAREHLTIEMALYLINELASKYGKDTRITNILKNKRIWILPNVNPDGSEYDISTGNYALWRKNRQPDPNGGDTGTDLNRNWGYKWGCCGGSSSDTSDETYRGTAAFSAPETAAIRNFVASRVINGKQQIKAGLDFHTYSELVMWPFGWTTDNVVPGMTQDDYNVYSTLGQKMAASNGYTPEQDSDLYITDGTIGDWLWGVHHVFSYTFEMYPNSPWPGFYPPGSVITRETTRDREAVLELMEASDCMYKVIGKQAKYCSKAASSATAQTDESYTGYNFPPNPAFADIGIKELH